MSGPRAPKEVRIRAVIALLVAVLALSVLPLVLDLTVQESNPFVYVAIQTLAMTVALIVYLYSTAKRRFGTNKIREIVGPARNLLVTAHTSNGGRRRSPIVAGLRTPLLWAVIVGLEYSLFGWSIRYVDAAVTAIIYGLWPLIMIYALIYLSGDADGAMEYHMPLRKRILTAVALVGLVIVVLGQRPEGGELFSGAMVTTFFGMSLALIAALLNGMNPAMSIHFSDLLYEIIAYDERVNRRLRARQKLWLALYAVTAGRLLSLPVNLVLGFVMFGGNLSITPAGALAAVATGLTLLPAASILLRLANLSIYDLGANALCYAEPVFTLVWLMLLTSIDVPRFDLFIVGAAIIVATNMLIHLIPDPGGTTDPASEAGMEFHA